MLAAPRVRRRTRRQVLPAVFWRRCGLGLSAGLALLCIAEPRAPHKLRARPSTQVHMRARRCHCSVPFFSFSVALSLLCCCAALRPPIIVNAHDTTEPSGWWGALAAPLLGDHSDLGCRAALN